MTLHVGGTTRRLVGDEPAELVRAADILRAGGLVVFATETVYGLGADEASKGSRPLPCTVASNGPSDERVDYGGRFGQG